ncbi:hypothetical protein FA10DRAFT_259353 [Acaromyces ingoldii]|uniref:Uncharacterized protein n=1 Tax=Acaromyces ingoldii TaxID=215250 RepID=A0A316YS10_9BASI|nr:hypothetical protein FA10DRAFT_259353 [Acaromyces ingoldii]PWN92099.1 hypothetical protein FA10DRAFT_259353 [Acaromyces ingoldii]
MTASTQISSPLDDRPDEKVENGDWSRRSRSGSCSLTILKAPRELPAIDARKPIYTAKQSQSARGAAPEPQKRLSLSFGRSGPAQVPGPGPASLHECKSAEGEVAVTVHLADSSVLLPFLDRQAEVDELLFSPSSRNATLTDRLRDVLGGEDSREWRSFSHLLVTTGREELNDIEWLRRLRDTVFPRSPSLWTQLWRCLGGEGIDLRQDLTRDHQHRARLTKHIEQNRWWNRALDNNKVEDDDNNDGDEEKEDFSSAYSHEHDARWQNSFDVEALHEVPSSYADCPSSQSSTSMSRDAELESKLPEGNRHDHQQGNGHRRRRSTSIYRSDGSDTYDFSAKPSGSFAGLRIVQNPHQPGSWRRASVLSSSSSSSGEDNVSVRFRKHRGLGSLIAPRSASTDSSVEQLGSQHRFMPRRKSIAMPDLVSRGGSLTPLSLKMTPAKMDEEKQRRSRHTISGPRSASTRGESINSLASSWSAGATSRPQVRKSVTFVTQPHSGDAAEASEGEDGAATPSKVGLLPDGRTRHPSAGSDDIAPGRNAFRDSLSKLDRSGDAIRRLDGAASFSAVGADDEDDPTESRATRQRHRSSISTASDTFSTGSQAVSSEDGSSIFDEHVDTPSEGGVKSPSRGGGYFLSPLPPPVHLHDADGHFIGLKLPDEASGSSAAEAGAAQKGGREIGAGSPSTSLSPPSVRHRLPSPTLTSSTYFTRYHPESTSQGKRGAALSPLDIGGKRGDTDAFLLSPGGTRHAIVFPVPPSPHVSRSKELSALMDRPEAQETLKEIERTISKEKIEEMRRLVARVDRSQLPDVALLEQVAGEIFGLVDHMDAEYCNDADARQRAEEVLVEDSYSQRWEAFAKVCQDVFHLTKHDIAEAKKRCGPALQFSLSP